MSDPLFDVDAPADLEFQSYPDGPATNTFGKRRPLPGHTLYAKGENGSLYGYGDLDGAAKVAYRRSRDGVITVLAKGLEDAQARTFLRTAHRALAASGCEPASMRWPLPSGPSRTMRLSAEPIGVVVSRKPDQSVTILPLAPGAKPLAISALEFEEFLSGDELPAALQSDDMRYFANGLRADLLNAMRDIHGFLSPDERLVAGMTAAVSRMESRAKDSVTMTGIKTMLKDVAIRVLPALSGAEIDASDISAVMGNLRVLMRGEPGRVFGDDGTAFVTSEVTPLMQRAIASHKADALMGRTHERAPAFS